MTYFIFSNIGTLYNQFELTLIDLKTGLPEQLKL